MKTELYSELRTIYETSYADPHTYRITIKLKDMIDGGVLRRAVDRTMQRYPYFAVRLRRDGAQPYFESNPLPVPVLETGERVTLGTEQTNYHLMAFCWRQNRLHIDAWHALTDGGGSYPMLKTLLYEYCSEYYGIGMDSSQVRLPGSPVSEAELADPARVPLSPEHTGWTEKWSSPAFQLADGGIVHLTPGSIATTIRIPEKDFIAFNLSNDGSPGTIAALLLARTIDQLHHDQITDEPVVIAMCVNQRKALAAPLAHQSLVGDVRLVYSRRMRDMPFDMQATCFRGMVALQSDTDMVLDEIRDYQALMRELEALPTYKERHAVCVDRMNRLSRCLTATVSYVGKAGMGDAERYIQEFDALPSTALPSSHVPLTVEMSAMNGSIFMNFIQYFTETDYFDRFIAQLRENNIDYDVLNRVTALYPNIEIPGGRGQ